MNFNSLGKGCGLAKATNRNVMMHQTKVTYIDITNEVMAGQFVLCIFQLCMYFVPVLLCTIVVPYTLTPDAKGYKMGLKSFVKL